MKFIEVKNKRIALPVFLPDATHGNVRCVNTIDLMNCKIEGVVVNAYHLKNDGELENIILCGGIANYMRYNGLFVSDSGGFQVMSLVHNNPSQGFINDNGVFFNFKGKRLFLTPEESIKIQINLRSDVVMCFDDCTNYSLSQDKQFESVVRTINWAKRCRREFDRLTRYFSSEEKPLLFAIIQGGNNFKLREKCFKELSNLNFDGYAFGGWPADDRGEFMEDIVRFTCNLIPNDRIKYAMGIGKPEDIVKCYRFGYDLFDCVIPTREARNNRLYIFKKKTFINLMVNPLLNYQFYDYLRIKNSAYSSDKTPVSSICDCYCCRNFSRRELYSMFKSDSNMARRLATIHNLRFYSKLFEILKQDRRNI